MIRPRLTVLDMMAIVLFAALLCFAVVLLEGPSIPGAAVALGIYLAALSVATLATTRLGRPRFRPFWRGVTLFGWLYLAIVLKFALLHEPYYERLALIALPLGPLCGMASAWLAPGSGGRDEPRPD